MFSNRFNTRNDPLLEAAEAAMKDGETRRQAEAFVNEQFGVYSRKAVVREELAAYDAALEEAYGALKEGVQIDELSRDTLKSYVKKASKDMRKTAHEAGKESEADDYWGREGKERYDRKPLRKSGKRLRGIQKATDRLEEEKAKKDYDKDGKIESPKDEVWGSRLRAAKMAGKLKEGTAEAETSMSVTKDNKPSTPAQTNASTSGPSASDKAALASKIKTMKENQIDELYGKGQIHKLRKGIRDEDQALSQEYGEGKYHNKRKRTPADHGKHGAYLKKARKVWDKSKRADALADAIAAKNLAKKKQDAAFAKNPRLKEETQVDEAAYSAKAARAGKDIGKPGKQFSKIAKSAAKRYGSEERGKKVAGAILARIRAKHMKEENLEELSAFGREFAAARSRGETQFMSKTTGKMTSTALKSPSSSASKPTGSSAIGGVNPGISTKQAAQGTTIKQSGGFSTDAPKPSASNYPDRGNVATGKSFAAIDKATNAAADKAATARVKAAVAGTDYAKPSKPADSNIGGKTQHWSDQGARERAGSMASQAATVKAAGDKPSAMTGTQNVPTPPSRPASISSTPAPATSQPGAPKSDASAGVKKLMSMNESVQIGDYKYRII